MTAYTGPLLELYDSAPYSRDCAHDWKAHWFETPRLSEETVGEQTALSDFQQLLSLHHSTHYIHCTTTSLISIVLGCLSKLGRIRVRGRLIV